MNLYASRRQKLIKSIEDDCTIVIFSGYAQYKSEDETYPFDVNRNFYYLTGLENESMALVMTKMNNQIKESLFILPYDEYLAKWVGGRMSAEEAEEISGIKDIQDYENLNSALASLFNRTRKNENHKFYFDLWNYDYNQTLTPAILKANELKEKHPAVEIKDIYPYLTKMRLIKDEYEISCIKKAIAITNAGVRKMMSLIKGGMNEMSLEGLFKFVLAQNLCNKTAFDTICAGGKRATILHYHDNNQELKDGEMFLCDLGASYNHYCADISRSFPVNGKFSDRQKEIYELVLGAQKLVEKNAKPGVNMRDLNKLVIDYYKEELPKHGLTKDVSEYYYHSVSHHLGLDTHDVDGGLGLVLEAGNVITNEPGLYIEEEEIGIRIEDDLLITENGCENLAHNIPKTVDDIEKIANK